MALSPRQQEHARTVWHPEDDPPEIELMHEGEAEEAEADEDVEDIVMEVPDQPTASASSAASEKKAHSTRAMHCAQSRLRHVTACLIFFSSLIHSARLAQLLKTDSAPQTGSWNIPHLTHTRAVARGLYQGRCCVVSLCSVSPMVIHTTVFGRASIIHTTVFGRASIFFWSSDAVSGTVFR